MLITFSSSLCSSSIIEIFKYVIDIIIIALHFGSFRQ